MRRWVHSVVLGMTIGVGLAVDYAAGHDTKTDDSGGSGGTSSSGPGTGTGVGGLDVNNPDTIDPDAACAKFTAEAKQSPAAMLIVLDRSASMGNTGKWSAAQLAVVSAIDKDVFDSMSLGLVTFPTSFGDPPACLCMGLDIATCKSFINNGQGVACGITALPQVALKEAGTDKSNAGMGVRHDIYNYLSMTSPVSDVSDASPIYDAMVAGYNALQAYPIDKRILILITDGGFSCTSVASPARPGYSDGACPDWEEPDTVNKLITDKRNDPSASVNTFIVGVPGSNSTGQMQGSYATPPYNMLLALSTYAVSGSPDTVDPTCDKAAVFTQGGAAPAKACHIDLSSGMFDANVLSSAIETIRGKALGCLYDMPPPPNGEMIDPTQVNVTIALEGGMPYGVPKRSSPSDMCPDLAGCWDYKDASDKQVELIGKACSDVSNAKQAKVDILVGCQTILK